METSPTEPTPHHISNKIATEVMRRAGVLFESSYRTQDGILVTETATQAASRLAQMGIFNDEYMSELAKAGIAV